MNNAIQIIESPRGWVAKFIGPHAAEITKLFGTNIIPTAFGAAAPRSTVLAGIQKLNPTALVFHRTRRTA